MSICLQPREFVAALGRTVAWPLAAARSGPGQKRNMLSPSPGYDGRALPAGRGPQWQETCTRLDTRKESPFSLPKVRSEQ